MKMKQYCRYCAEATESADYEDVVWCAEKQKEMSHAAAKRQNNCPLFRFCEIDVFDPDKRYKPREKKEKRDNGQLPLFES